MTHVVIINLFAIMEKKLKGSNRNASSISNDESKSIIKLNCLPIHSFWGLEI